MKHITFILLLLFITPFLSAQSEFNIYSNDDDGTFINDSLTAASPYKTFTTKYRYESFNVTIRDTGATYDDSIKVEYTYPTGSTWYPVQFLKDSTWEQVAQPLVDDASQHAYFGWCSNYYRIRIYRMNAEVVADRTTYITLQLNKK